MVTFGVVQDFVEMTSRLVILHKTSFVRLQVQLLSRTSPYLENLAKIKTSHDSRCKSKVNTKSIIQTCIKVQRVS